MILTFNRITLKTMRSSIKKRQPSYEVVRMSVKFTKATERKQTADPKKKQQKRHFST